MEEIKLVEYLNKKVKNGDIIKVNERHSFEIGVIDGNKNFCCTVIMDLYKDKEGNDLYRIEQHIDIKKDYHTIDVVEYTNGFF